MHRIFSEKIIRWLLPVVLILFLLEVMTFPFALGITYSDRNVTPGHLLTYTEGALTWDNATGIDENGVAELDLFDAVYPGAEAEDGRNVIAPGAEGDNIVRLKNSVSGSISYTAVLYRIRTSEELPVVASLDGKFSETSDYPLPEEVRSSQVIRAVAGTLNGGEVQDFDISWAWNYYEDDERDAADTMLGDELVPDKVTVGLYIVVEDANGYISPKTGDSSNIGVYGTLMSITFVLLVLLCLERVRERKLEEEENALEEELQEPAGETTEGSRQEVTEENP